MDLSKLALALESALNHLPATPYRAVSATWETETGRLKLSLATTADDDEDDDDEDDEDDDAH